MARQSHDKHVIVLSKESRLNFTAIDHSYIQKGRIQFFIGATRLDNDGENENEILIASKSILQTPVKQQKRELYCNNSRLSINSAEG